MREKERDYLTCHTSREQINVLRRAFIYAQKTFDKKLKQAEMVYSRVEIHIRIRIRNVYSVRRPGDPC